MAHAFQTEKTLSGLFFTQAEKYKDDLVLFGKFEKGMPVERWVGMLWSEVADQVRQLGAGLIELGINQGDRIAIFSENRPRWVIADHAIQGSLAWGVPMYPTSTDEQMIYILNDCKARAVFTGDEKLTAQVARLKSQLPSLEYIIAMTPTATARARRVVNFDQVMERGAKSEKALSRI